MDPAHYLPLLLGAAWLLPLVSFLIIWVGYSLPQMAGKRASYGISKLGAYVATGSIVLSVVLSFTAMFGVWLPSHPLAEATHQSEDDHAAASSSTPFKLIATESESHDTELHDTEEHANNPAPKYYSGEWYNLYETKNGSLKLSIGYYIDALTVGMFCMVSLIATCVHFYALGYMHDELHDFTDPEVTLSNGEQLTRPGRYHRFFQYLSLFSFSMLGVVIAGNMAMVFVFWELVGICSYFLIGFYIERHSASTAANKAFIVNRVGDFGMLIGMMALWSSLGTFTFGDAHDAEGNVTEHGVFSQLRTAENNYQLVPTDSMVAEQQRITPHGETASEGEPASADGPAEKNTAGQWLLLIAGVGIFCGCVGKSAQFPLHVWLPDAMEGPTPVSALVHSATMVAAGVYLVGRFYPVFSPETLLVIAYIGCITLLIAATIAITAVDIKRVLAYSTISQLGYMMLSLGLGGWVAGMFHLITHAFFKSLLFLCSGSVIHAVHSNDMTDMGGLRKKMPITAYTMLASCLAIIGAGIPLSTIGFSGYYSKDAIIEQAFSFGSANPKHLILQWAPVVGAAITAFYMFRLWYMTFAGKPRDQHRYDHAHESPRVMTGPLVLLAVFAIGVGWTLPGTDLNVTNLLEQARPVGTLETTRGTLLSDLVVPNEHLSHNDEFRVPAGIAAFSTAAGGLLLATIIYLWNWLNPNELKQSFRPLHSWLWNKWWFDELYEYVFVKPTLILSGWMAKCDLKIIDSILHGAAALCRGGSQVVDRLFDQTMVDGSVNTFARGTWNFGLWLRKLQTGSLRQYVMFIVVGTVLLFVAITFVQGYLTTS
jgi:proton-translocating NADH-quinone oxidoreductase chain L